MFRQVTDLDEASDDKKIEDTSLEKKQAPPKPKRHDKKLLKTLSGNFNSNRSKSHEGFRITDKKNVRQLLEIKDDQIEKLVEKLTSLIEYNRQFAKENDRLVEERGKLMDNVDNLKKQLHKLDQQECKECQNLKKTIETTRQSYERHSKDNLDLQNDVKMLKVLVYRLNIQIERYQEFYRKHKDGQIGSHNDQLFMIDFQKHEEIPPEYVWGGISSGVLAPLLNAYEEMITEKVEVISQFEQEMSNFTGKLKIVLEENEVLRKNFEELQRNSDIWLQERERLQAAADLYRNKADVQGKRADLGKEKLVEVIRVYEQKVQSQSLDIERLQEAYSRCKGELSGLKQLHEKPESVVDGLKECQRLFEELKNNHDKEKIKLTQDLNILNQKYEESREKLQSFTEETRELKVSLEKEKEAHILLAEKYAGLKANINRIRQSKEMLRNRLKAVISWGKGLEEGKTKVEVSETYSV